MAKKFTEEQINFLISEYQSGKSINQIAKEHHKDSSTLCRILKEHNVPRNPRNTEKIAQLNAYTEDEKQEIIDLFLSGKSLSFIRKHYHRDMKSMTKLLRERGIDSSQRSRKHIFNQDFFNSIESEKQAYWLGFIMADGSITQTDDSCLKPNRLQINISIVDIGHLYKFALDMDAPTIEPDIYTPSEETYGDREMCRIYFNSSSMCSRLNDLGVIQNKTGYEIMPELPLDLQRHFIRGFFDGDGCITSGPSFYICGNQQILLQIQNILMSRCSLNQTKLVSYPHKKADIYNLTYGGKLQLQRIYHFLYDDATIFLERKKLHFRGLTDL